MRTEIEKMFENAGVKPRYKKRTECKDGYTVGHPCEKGIACINCNRSVFEDVMPPFTAEKQLELIKWLAHKDYDKDALLININGSNYTYFSLGINSCDDGNGLYEDYCFGSGQFDEALAGVVNLIWQDLTDQEKEEIRGILND